MSKNSSNFHPPQSQIQPQTPARPDLNSSIASQSSNRSKSVKWGDQTQAGPSFTLVHHDSHQRPAGPQQNASTSTSNSSTPNRQTVAFPLAPCAASSQNPPSKPMSQPTLSRVASPLDSKDQGGLSVPALKVRLIWNSTALLVLFALPKLEVAKKIYWSFINATYAAAGPGADDIVDSVLAWTSWATFITFLINLVEASVQLGFEAKRPARSTCKPNGLRRPPGSIAIPVVPSPVKSSANLRSSPIRYSVHSPLKASLQAAGQNTSSILSQHSASPSSLQRRIPSGSPSTTGGGSSPLAAFLARRALSRETSSSLTMGGDAEVGDSSSESIEVDRALRALSGDFARQSSGQERSAIA